MQTGCVVQLSKSVLLTSSVHQFFYTSPVDHLDQSYRPGYPSKQASLDREIWPHKGYTNVDLLMGFET